MEGQTLRHWNFASPDRVQQWDVDLVVKDQHFYAHRLILSVVSPYFEAMFNGEFREKDQKAVRIKEGCIIPLTEYANFCQAQPLLDKCHKALEGTRFAIPSLDKLQVAVKTGALKLVDRVIESLTAVKIVELNRSPLAEELEKTPSSLRKIIARSASLALAAQNRSFVSQPCITDWGETGTSW